MGPLSGPEEVRTVRIGAVADTHVLEVLPELPREVLETLEGCGLILHAGDVTDPVVLEQLEEVAPVIAVEGDHDRAAGLMLPRDQVVEVAGHRIGLTHGRRARGVEIAAAALSTARARVTTLGLEHELRRRLGAVDMVVYGHLHVARISRSRGVSFVNPGGVYTLSSDPAHHQRGLRAWAHARALSSVPAQAHHSSVAVIHVEPGEPIRAEIRSLTQPIRPSATA